MICEEGNYCRVTGLLLYHSPVIFIVSLPTSISDTPRAKPHTTSTPSSGSDAVPLSVDMKQSSGDSSDACAWNDPHTLLTLGHRAWFSMHCEAEAELALTIQTVMPSGPLLVSEAEQ